jgi:hypothetical protein
MRIGSWPTRHWRDISMNNDTDLSSEKSDRRWLTYDQLASLRRSDGCLLKAATASPGTVEIRAWTCSAWLSAASARDRHDAYVDGFGAA